MRHIFESATVPSRGRFWTLSAFTLLLVLLALASAPWHPAIASDATVPKSVVSLAITSDADSAAPSVSVSCASPRAGWLYTTKNLFANIRFSEPVRGFTSYPSDVSITQDGVEVTTRLGSLTVRLNTYKYPSEYQFSAELDDDVSGTVLVQVPASAATDENGNPNTASNPLHVAPNRTLSVSDASATEGSDATIDFEVVLSDRDDCSTVTVDWEVSDGTATAGEDYTDASGTLTFAPGENTKTISVSVLDDSDSEGVETLFLSLSNPSGAKLVSQGIFTWPASPTFYRAGRAQGTIYTDEDTDAPSVTITSNATAPVDGWFEVLVTFSEPTSGFEMSELEIANASAVAIRSSPDGREHRVSVVPAAIDLPYSNSLEDDLPPLTDAMRQIDVSIAVPAAVATDSLGNANTASAPFVIDALGDPTQGRMIILSGPHITHMRCGDGDAPKVLNLGVEPTIHVEFELSDPNNELGHEEDRDSIALTQDGVRVDFNAYLNRRPQALSTTHYDYTAAIRPGVTGTVAFQILYGAFSSAATFGRSAASERMYFAGHNWTASVADATATEGTDATIDFEVTLNARDDCKTVTVDWATEDGTASAGADYTAASGTLTFEPGETTKTVSVAVVDDTVSDTGETFTLRLSNALGLEITDAEATGTILDDDTDPLTASFENAPGSHDGSTTFAFELHFGGEIEGLSYRTVRDEFFDVSGGRVTKAGRLTRGKNQKWKVTVEPTSTADIVITTRGTESCDAAHAVCTADGRIYAGGDSITVARYALSVADADVREGPDATLDFVVTLSRERTETTTVDYATSDGTATAGTDYTAASGTLTFAAGETSKTVSVAVLDDAHDEGVETLSLTLSNAEGAQIADTIATGTVADDESQQTVEALTASFENVPESHDGSTAFTFEVHFSEEPAGLSYVTVRDGLFDVSGGTVTKAGRVTRGSNLAFVVTVQPSADTDVTLTVRGTDDCEAPHAICVGDDRKLAAGASATITVTPIAVTVADTEVEEAEGATLDFVVSMTRASARDIQIWYRSYDGTATAGADYVAVYSSFTMTAGETTKTVSVSVLDDAHDEGAETVNFWLSGVRGLSASQLTDPYAVGTITNSDPMPAAWITRFGRTVGSQVIDAVTSRFEGATDSHVTIGGQRIGVSELFEAADTPVFEDLRQWAEGDENDRAEWRDEGRALTGREILLGSSFHLSAGNGAEGGTAFTAWGEVATGGFEADVDDVRMDGAVTTGMIGIDAEWDRLLAGVMLSRSEGDGKYRLSAALGNDGGTVESSLTGVYPYLRLEMGEGVSAWGLAGYGTGSLTLRQDGQDPIETDLGMRMGAVGARGTVLDRPSEGGLELAVKSDAMWVQTESDRTVGLESAEGDVTRVRVILEGDRVFNLGDDETLTPKGEIGLRHDGGDAETGTGVEIGAGIRYAGGTVSVEASVRTLVAHEESGYEEWGASGAIHVSPDASGRGLSLSIARGWGSTTGGTDRLWSAGDPTAFGLDNAYQPEGRLEAELGYGLGLSGRGSVLTPYVGLGLGGGESRVYRMGSRWQVVRDVTLDLEGARREDAAGNGAEHGLMLRGKMRW